MLQEWLTKGVFLYLMAGVCGAGVVLKVLLSTYYNRQLYWTQRMATTRKKWLIRMQEDYEECMDEDGQVNNVDVFVDKYIEGKKFMGILLSTWNKIGGQAWILCAGLLAVSAVSSVFYQVEREAVLFTFFIGTWTVIAAVVVDNIANLTEKKKQMKRNLVDYFENRIGVQEELFLDEENKVYELDTPDTAFCKEEQDSAKGEETAQKDIAFRRPEPSVKEGSYTASSAVKQEAGVENIAQSNAAFSAVSASKEEESGAAAQFGAAREEENSNLDEYAGTIHIRHLSKMDRTSQQNAALKEGAQNNTDRKQTGKAEPPKFYVINGAEKKAAQDEEISDEDAVCLDTAEKKARRESKKDMIARQKREHIKYELKREITQDAKRSPAGQKEEEPLAESLENTAEPKEASQNVRRAPSREAIEQLAAAIELLKKENILEETAPLLAAQIGKDQENGALIEEVLKEFLI